MPDLESIMLDVAAKLNGLSELFIRPGTDESITLSANQANGISYLLSDMAKEMQALLDEEEKAPDTENLSE